mgnify:CR=1 FL=1
MDNFLLSRVPSLKRRACSDKIVANRKLIVYPAQNNLISLMHIVKKYIALVFCILLGACATEPVKLDQASHLQKIKQDKQSLIKQADGNQALHIDLNTAVEKALAKNFDARLALFNFLAQQDKITLQKLNVLPSLDATAQFIGRSNKGASSSESALSGEISLEPSFSTEPRRARYDIEAKWKLTDAALAYIDSRIQSNQQKILKARYKKVQNGIVRDVYSAYWKAYYFQEIKSNSTYLLRHMWRHSQDLDEARAEKLVSAKPYMDQKQEFAELRSRIQRQSQNLELALTQLKSLMGLSLKADIRLEAPEYNQIDQIHSVLGAEIEKYEDYAFRNRPELREEYLNINTQANKRRKEILGIIPGAELLYGYNKDKNELLRDNNWFNYSASLTQSLKKLIELPKQLDVLENEKQRARLKRLNLGFAILSQVHISRAQLEFTLREYNNSKALYQQASFGREAESALLENGMISRGTYLAARAREHLANIRNKNALSDLHGAYANFLHATGQGPPFLKGGELYQDTG